MSLCQSQVKSQLELVQKAVDIARRRHRQSIVQAVQNRGGLDAIRQRPVSSESPMSLSGASRERVQKIFDVACSKEQSDSRASRARLSPCTLMALMNTRASEKGLPVHC